VPLGRARVAEAFGGSGPAAEQIGGEGSQHRGFAFQGGWQDLLASIEDGVIEAVTRNGDEQFRRQGRPGHTS
jgi:hypothetical protein